MIYNWSFPIVTNLVRRVRRLIAISITGSESLAVIQRKIDTFSTGEFSKIYPSNCSATIYRNLSSFVFFFPDCLAIIQFSASSSIYSIWWSVLRNVTCIFFFVVLLTTSIGSTIQELFFTTTVIFLCSSSFPKDFRNQQATPIS